MTKISKDNAKERSAKVSATRRAKWTSHVCPQCGITFTPPPRKERLTQKRFCSLLCYKAYHSTNKALQAKAKLEGRKTYSTKNPCQNGHLTERYTSNGTCIECSRLSNEKLKGYHKEWTNEHKDHLKNQRHQNYMENREQRLQQSKEYQRKNPAARLKRNQRYHATEKGSAMRRTALQKRRSLKLKASGTFTKNDWIKLLSRSPHCHWCKRRWTKTRRPTHDHIIPLFKGGDNSPENSVCSCGECNSAKGAKLINPVTGQGILL